MTRRIFTILGALALSAGIASAQTGSDLLRFSQYNYSLGTARSAAMGGAFSSLGADLSSVGINPAGLGMYKKSDVGLSMSVTTNKTTSDYTGFNPAGSQTYSDYGSHTRFSLNNAGAALKVHDNPKSTVRNIVVAFTANKMADFYTTANAYTMGNQSSITEYFSESLYGVNSNDIGRGPYVDPYYNPSIAISQWGGALAYQTRLINNVPGETTSYTPFDGTGADCLLDPAATVNPSLVNNSRGYVYEYAFAAGFSIKDKLYLGLTLGIQDVYYTNGSGYNEYYSGVTDPILYNTQGLSYTRRLTQDGTGVNFKFGVIYRPIPSLRLSAAVHTPTFLTMEEEYYETMNAFYDREAMSTYSETIVNPQEYDINTPTRFLAGLSWTLPGGIGIITADYERVWYNGMRLRNTYYSSYSDQVNNETKEIYKAANNFRVGAEFVLSKMIFLRAGYAYYGDCFNSDYKNNIAKRSVSYLNYNYASGSVYGMDGIGQIANYSNYSGGIGFHFKYINLELAYVRSHYNYAPYEIFYAYVDGTPENDIQSGSIKSTMNRDTFIASLSFRF